MILCNPNHSRNFTFSYEISIQITSPSFFAQEFHSVRRKKARRSERRNQVLCMPIPMYNEHGALCHFFNTGDKSVLGLNCITIIFHTMWHFAAASRLKFSHDDFQTYSDWIFKINEICISNRKPTNTLTNRIQRAFGVYFFKILQNTWTVR